VDVGPVAARGDDPYDHDESDDYGDEEWWDDEDDRDEDGDELGCWEGGRFTRHWRADYPGLPSGGYCETLGEAVARFAVALGRAS